MEDQAFHSGHLQEHSCPLVPSEFSSSQTCKCQFSCCRMFSCSLSSHFRFWLISPTTATGRLSECLDFITQHYFILGDSQVLKTLILTNIMNSPFCLPHDKTSSPAAFEIWANSVKFSGFLAIKRGFSRWQECEEHQHLRLLLFRGGAQRQRTSKLPHLQAIGVFFVLKREVAFPLETQNIPS